MSAERLRHHEAWAQLAAGEHLIHDLGACRDHWPQLAAIHDLCCPGGAMPDQPHDLDIAFITLGLLVALAAISAAAYAVHRAHRRHISDRRPIPAGTGRAALNTAQGATAPHAIQAPRPAAVDVLIVQNQARRRR
jgi:hypothetical protein